MIKENVASLFDLPAVIQHEDGLLEIDLWPSVEHNNIWDQILSFYI
jgi:hypothetical protein